MRTSNEFALFFVTGSLWKLLKIPALVGAGNRLRTLMAFGSSRSAGRMFPAKASRTKQVGLLLESSGQLESITGRVVAGSKIVPHGAVLPSTSVWVQVWAGIRSEKLVKPLARSASV